MTTLLRVVALNSFSLNLFADAQDMLSYDFMRYAFLAGTAVALLGGLAGYFVVLRHLAFAGEALSHVAFTAVLAAVVISIDPLVALFVITAGVALAMGMVGQQARAQDVAIGTTLAWILALGALLLSIYTTTASGGNSQIGVNTLFGSILGVPLGAAQTAAIVAGVAGVVLLGIARPLIFASIDPAVAAAQGVPVRLLSLIFLMILGITVAEAVQVVGALLILALLVTPAAIAHRVTARPYAALALSPVLALLMTWMGIGAGYYTPYPISFWITTLAFGGYVTTVLGQQAGKKWSRRGVR